MKTVSKNRIRKAVDVCMTVILLLLMAYQVTGEALHEWLGVIVTILVIVHQILNRKWYASLLKGKYNLYRIMTAVIDVLLIVSFLLTAVCGMAMSSYAVPFFYGMVPVSFARRMHLSLSHWAFVLMGIHLGLHIPAMTAGMKLSGRARGILAWIAAALSGYGFYLFLSKGMLNYLFFRVSFAFYDEKAAAMVIFEAVMILVFWVLIGSQAANLCRIRLRKNPYI